jgi:uncharacterized protein YecT (DUF1311 family)
MMLLAGLLAAASAAAPVHCGDLSVQTEMNQCFAARARRADAALNVSWRKLMAKAGTAKPAYLSAQRLWIQFRDAECVAEAKLSEGGTLHPTEVSACYADLTEARTKTIDQLAGQDR